MYSNTMATLGYVPSRSVEAPGNNVNIGIGPGLGVTVERPQFSYGFVMITVLGVIIGIILVIVMLLIAFYYNPSTPISVAKSPNPMPNILGGDPVSSLDDTGDFRQFSPEMDNPGASLHPEEHNRFTVRSTGSLPCHAGRHGPNCQWLKHDISYQALGQISDHSQLKTIGEVRTSARSFSVDSCSRYCDVHQECRGFYHEGDVCKLLSSVELHEVPQGGMANNLFSRKGASSLPLVFKDKVWFGDDAHRFGPRYWLNKKLFPVEVGYITCLKFRPSQVRMHGRVAYFADRAFSSLEEWGDLPSGHRYSTSSDKFTLPTWWKYIWVLVL
jgi:hypothetical protein